MLGRAKNCHDLLLAVDRLDALKVLIIWLWWNRFADSIEPGRRGHPSLEVIVLLMKFNGRNPGFIGPSFGPSNTELAGMIASFTINYVIGKIPNRNWSQGLNYLWDSMVFPRKSVRG
ncbi:hypothetical protein [Pseudomonas sp. NPDC086278]|uniref:hypothetical protein n=1 Tax=Pseudomonas sp. NPDC086278 TaxID=3390646 RepID=UPI003D066C39